MILVYIVQLNYCFNLVRKCYSPGIFKVASTKHGGRVYYILSFKHRWLVKPAPTSYQFPITHYQLPINNYWAKTAKKSGLLASSQYSSPTVRFLLILDNTCHPEN